MSTAYKSRMLSMWLPELTAAPRETPASLDRRTDMLWDDTDLDRRFDDPPEATGCAARSIDVWATQWQGRAP